MSTLHLHVKEATETVTDRSIVSLQVGFTELNQIAFTIITLNPHFTYRVTMQLSKISTPPQMEPF